VRIACHRRTPHSVGMSYPRIGAGDPKIHASYNWTKGCIALTNSQIDELAQWIRLGVRVVIY